MPNLTFQGYPLSVERFANPFHSVRQGLPDHRFKTGGAQIVQNPHFLFFRSLQNRNRSSKSHRRPGRLLWCQRCAKIGSFRRKTFPATLAQVAADLPKILSIYIPQSRFFSAIYLSLHFLHRPGTSENENTSGQSESSVCPSLSRRSICSSESGTIHNQSSCN